MFKKKITLILIIISIIFRCNFVNAEEECNDKSSCSIKDGTARVLQDYMKNLRIVSTNVTKSLTLSKSTDSKLKKDTSSLKNDFTKSFNSIIDWDTFYPSYKFVELQVTSEVPYEVSRDRLIIKNEIKRLQGLLQTIIKRGYGDKIIDNPCNGISENCSLTGSSLDIMTNLIKNTNSVLVLFDSSITQTNEENLETKYLKDFILVGDNFKDEMRANYNKSTLTQCSMCNGFFQRAKKSIGEISDNMKYSEKGIQKWKDSWAKLQGLTQGSDQSKLERELLAKELARKGLKTSQAEIILGNLDKFNAGGLSLDNNPIVNSINTFKDLGGQIYRMTKDTVNPFNQSISDSKTPKGGVDPRKMQEIQNIVKNTDETSKNISDEYGRLKLSAGVETKDGQQVIAEVISMHIELSEIAKILKSACEPAKKACEEQGRGMGNCGTCD